jgi:hypothetical protein
MSFTQASGNVAAYWASPREYCLPLGLSLLAVHFASAGYLLILQRKLLSWVEPLFSFAAQRARAQVEDRQFSLSDTKSY